MSSANHPQPSSRAITLGGWILGLVVLSVSQPAAFAGAYKHLIGYDQLAAEYTGPLPDGATVRVAMVESEQRPQGADPNLLYYFPQPSHAQLIGTDIVQANPLLATANSTHSRGTALHFFGSTWGVASGVDDGTTDVLVFETNDFLTTYLKHGTDNEPESPAVLGYKVLNNSWAGEIDSSSGDLEALRRIDYLVDTYDTIVPVGVFNASPSVDPAKLLGQSYNTITVGRADALHIAGLTDFNLYGPGRVKPDIVGPEITSSRNTAIVSSVATALYQSATDTNPTLQFNTNADAARSEPMKAILLAGATKDQAINNDPSTGLDGVWNADATDQPLDLTFGAGMVNFRNSFLIQQAGQQPGSATTGAAPLNNYGWDYGQITDGNSVFYELEVPDYHTAIDFSAVLTWNVEVVNKDDGDLSSFDPIQSSPSALNLDLKLYDSSSTLLSTINTQSLSNSLVDNVEHIWWPELAAGSYTLEVVSVAGDRDYGLAWRFDTPHQTTGDYNEDGRVDSLDYALWRETLGSDSDLRADGDLSGIVDAADFQIWLSHYGVVLPSSTTQQPAAPALIGALGAAPEPTSGALLALASGAMLLHRRRR